ncbi:SHOCT domain-containing protein [Vibrio cyclitrophicus]|uniref:SHOCT domain-containing protein n=1 Tax=Vibrio cyclitrophicus TaxID=47951 RepID=UPI001112CB4E|nr:SHOCT domain-containing protein [Vibrio cyclitrophicus]
MMLIWIVVIGVVLWVVLSPKGVSSMNRETPLAIAKGRYAKGEITPKELDDIKRNL